MGAARLRKQYGRVVCVFNLYTEHIMRNVGLNELQAGIKKDRRNNNLRYADDNTLMAESKKEQNNLLVRVKEESEKAGLKINIKTNYDHGIWPHYFMANKRGKYGSSDRFPVLVQSATVSMSPIPVGAKLRLCLPASKQQTCVPSPTLHTPAARGDAPSVLQVTFTSPGQSLGLWCPPRGQNESVAW